MIIEEQLRQLAMHVIKTLDKQQEYFQEEDIKKKRKLLVTAKSYEQDLRRFALYCLDNLNSERRIAG